MARQIELPFPEVHRFDNLWRLAVKMHGFTKMVKIDLATKRQHRSDPAGYVRAMTAKLEELTTEPQGGTDRVEVRAGQRQAADGEP